MPLRICILETDILRPELVDSYKGYGVMFEQLFAQQPIPVQFSVYNVVQGHYPPEGERFDAYLVTGSKADAFGTDPWILKLKAFLLERYEAGDKLLGVCFGHQLLALSLGGKVERAAQGWGVGTHGYRLIGKPRWMIPARDRFSLLVSHQDQVTELPKGATLLACSDFCANAAYAVGEQVLCFQGHPEFVRDYSRALLELRQDYLGEGVYEQGVGSLEREHDGTVVAEWMMRFVADGRWA